MAKAKPLRRKIVYPNFGAEVRKRDGKGGALLISDAKALLGWEEEPEKEEWAKGTYHFRDRNGVKVRLTRALTNRPFRASLAKRAMLEILRDKWEGLNGETIILDRLGFVQDGQHRLVGFVWAFQEIGSNFGTWSEYTWGEEHRDLEALIVTGVSEKAQVVDTINLGQKRSVFDVLYRRYEFGRSLSDGETKALHRILASALRLVWLRMGGKTVSDAPHFPPSEAVEFLEAHPRLTEACLTIQELDGGKGAEGRAIRDRVELGTAAGLLYLMGYIKTDPEGEANDSIWPRAVTFWKKLASGAGLEKGQPILTVRELLPKFPASSGKDRDRKIGMLVKAFNAWIDKESLTVRECRVRETTHPDTGQKVLAETPRLGGFDVEYVKPEVDPGWKKGETAWVTGDGDPWYATVDRIHASQKKVDVLDSVGTTYTVGIGALQVEKPGEDKT